MNSGALPNGEPSATGFYSKADWLRAALTTLRERGVQGLKLRVLTQKLNVTTGSFYWHFRSWPELLDDLLDFWEQESTQAAMEFIGKLDGSPSERIRALARAAVTENLDEYDLAIENWGFSSPKVAETHSRVYSIRQQFTEKLFRETGLPLGEARARAAMFSAYVRGEYAVMAKRGWSLKQRLACLDRQLDFILAGIPDKRHK